MADEFDNAEWHVVCAVNDDSRMLKAAQTEGLTPDHFRRPGYAKAYREFIENPKPEPNGRFFGGTFKHVGKCAAQLVAAHTNREPWVEPPREQPAQFADQQPTPTTETPKKIIPAKKRGKGKRRESATPDEQPPAEIPREILFLNQVVLDDEVPPNSFRIAYVISQLWNPRTDDAWPAQSRIAEILKLDRSTVRKLTAPLEERGHLQVTPGRGRGNTSRYRPIIKKPEIRRLIATEKPSTPTVEK
jgi:DNA-binding MarR family transcriptional regulator